jgi:hypothetical protein
VPGGPNGLAGGMAMATKAEWFRYTAERAGLKKASAAKIPTVAAALAAKGKTEPHNLATRSGKKAIYALEESAGKPSRKSSRKSSNRQKTDAQFRMKREASEVRTSTKTGVGRKR